MKKATKAKLSMIFCLSLSSLGMSHANDKNTLQAKNDIIDFMVAAEDAIMSNGQVNSSKKEDNNLEGFIQNTISGKFDYSLVSNLKQKKFTHLSANKAFDNEKLFNEDVSFDEKLKKVQQLQNVAAHISKTSKVDLNKVEEIVLASVVQAEKEGLDPALLLSLISIESTFKTTAHSHAGAMGLTQVIPKYHPEKIAKIGHAKNLYTIDGALKVGVEVLKEYLERSKGNLRTALQMYNGSLGDKNYKYSKKVIAQMERYKKFFEM